MIFTAIKFEHNQNKAKRKRNSVSQRSKSLAIHGNKEKNNSTNWKLKELSEPMEGIDT